MILDDIIAHKKNEVAQAKTQVPFPELQKRLANRPGHPLEPGRFRQAIDCRLGTPVPAPVRLIAEIKKASPSKGIFREDFDHLEWARTYARSSASALSVLTDEKYFAGSLDILRRIAGETDLPLLRKDFVIDPYQLLEAAVAGASAVLLIVAVLGKETMRFIAQTRQLGLDALVEVHDAAELEIALAAGAKIIGVNNRDLRTFKVDLETSLALAARMPEGITKVSESGIAARCDVVRLGEAGFQAVLVGESLVRSADPITDIHTLLFENPS